MLLNYCRCHDILFPRLQVHFRKSQPLPTYHGRKWTVRLVALRFVTEKLTLDLYLRLVPRRVCSRLESVDGFSRKDQVLGQVNGKLVATILQCHIDLLCFSNDINICFYIFAK